MSKTQSQFKQIVPGKALAVKVNSPAKEDLANALKTFKRKIKSSEVLEQTKARKEFIKPSVVNRKKHQDAKFMQMVRNQHAN